MLVRDPADHAKRRDLEQLGAAVVNEVADTAAQADVVVLCVFTDEQVRHVCLDSALLSTMGSGSTLVVQTDHLEAATITNNGLDHSENIKVTERFRLSPDGKALLATQEYADPAVIQNRGVRFIAWSRQPGQHVYPYECDPGFAGNYKAK